MANVNDLERISFPSFLKDKSREKVLLDKDILQMFVLHKKEGFFLKKKKWQKCNYRKMGTFSSCWFILPLNALGSFILQPKWQKRCRNGSPLKWKTWPHLFYFGTWNVTHFIYWAYHPTQTNLHLPPNFFLTTCVAEMI